MTPEQFACWFGGFAEMHPEPPTAAQWKMMREHVATVFDKVTPPLVTEEGALPRRAMRLDYPLDEVRRKLYPRPSISRDRIIC